MRGADELITVGQAAEILGVHKTQVARLLKDGRLSYVTLPPKYRRQGVWRYLRREPSAQSRRPAREVQHTHPGFRRDQLDHALPAARLAPGHDLVEPALVRGRVAAEDGREELLGLQPRDLH